MPKINLILGDPDEIYLKAVETYLMEHFAHRFHVYSYSVAAHLEKKLATGRDQVQLLLLHPRFLTEGIRETYEDSLLLLSEGELPSACSHLPAIYKYQRGDRIASEIMHYLAEKKLTLLPEREPANQSQLVLIYSPEGGIGKTTVAIGLAHQFAERGVPVLYLNFETFGSTPRYFDCGDSEKMAQLLYYIKAKDPRLPIKLEGIRMRDPLTGIHYFSAPDQASDFSEITEEELDHFLRVLLESGGYRHILLDLDTQWNERTRYLLKRADRVILLASGTEVGEQKRSQLMGTLERDGALTAGGTEKILLCYNQTRENQLRFTGGPNPAAIASLPYTPTLCGLRSGRLQFSPNTPFMQGLSQVASKLEQGKWEAKPPWKP